MILLTVTSEEVYEMVFTSRTGELRCEVESGRGRPGYEMIDTKLGVARLSCWGWVSGLMRE